MPKLIYLSSSHLPSTSANSINVIHMASGFASLGLEVTLLGRTGNVIGDIKAYYDYENVINNQLLTSSYCIYLYFDHLQTK